MPGLPIRGSVRTVALVVGLPSAVTRGVPSDRSAVRPSGPPRSQLQTVDLATPRAAALSGAFW